MLAGVLMSDQRGRDAGNLWVRPGTHLTHAECFRAHGPEAFFAAARRAVCFRVKRAGHDPRWREFLQDPRLDSDAVRGRLGVRPERMGNRTPG